MQLEQDQPLEGQKAACASPCTRHHTVVCDHDTVVCESDDRHGSIASFEARKCVDPAIHQEYPAFYHKGLQDGIAIGCLAADGTVMQGPRPRKALHYS